MSAADLLAVDEYHERRKAALDYHEAAAAVAACRIEVDTWERRERDARARLRKAVELHEIKGWMLP